MDFDVDIEGMQGNKTSSKGVLQDYVKDNGGLFDAYPELKGIKVVFVDEQGNVGGSYNSATNTIKVNTRSNIDVRDVLLHEVQHAIQKIEGFAEGASLLDFKRTAENLINDL